MTNYDNLSRRCPCGECDTYLERGNRLVTVDDVIRGFQAAAEIAGINNKENA